MVLLELIDYWFCVTCLLIDFMCLTVHHSPLSVVLPVW